MGLFTKYTTTCNGFPNIALGLLCGIEAVGARTWLNPPDLPRHVVWWMCGSDQGPDQVACDRLMDIDLYSKPSVFKVRIFCFQHQLRGVEQTGKACKLYQELVTRHCGHVDNEIRTGEHPACFQTVVTTTFKGPVALDTFF